jgi:hypothetical protein
VKYEIGAKKKKKKAYLLLGLLELAVAQGARDSQRAEQATGEDAAAHALDSLLLGLERRHVLLAQDDRLPHAAVLHDLPPRQHRLTHPQITGANGSGLERVVSSPRNHRRSLPRECCPSRRSRRPLCRPSSWTRRQERGTPIAQTLQIRQ